MANQSPQKDSAPKIPRILGKAPALSRKVNTVLQMLGGAATSQLPRGMKFSPRDDEEEDAASFLDEPTEYEKRAGKDSGIEENREDTIFRALRPKHRDKQKAGPEPQQAPSKSTLVRITNTIQARLSRHFSPKVLADVVINTNIANINGMMAKRWRLPKSPRFEGRNEVLQNLLSLRKLVQKGLLLPEDDLSRGDGPPLPAACYPELTPLFQEVYDGFELVELEPGIPFQETFQRLLQLNRRQQLEEIRRMGLLVGEHPSMLFKGVSPEQKKAASQTSHWFHWLCIAFVGGLIGVIPMTIFKVVASYFAPFWGPLGEPYSTWILGQVFSSLGWVFLMTFFIGAMNASSGSQGWDAGKTLVSGGMLGAVIGIGMSLYANGGFSRPPSGRDVVLATIFGMLGGYFAAAGYSTLYPDDDPDLQEAEWLPGVVEFLPVLVMMGLAVFSVNEVKDEIAPGGFASAKKSIVAVRTSGMNVAEVKHTQKLGPGGRYRVKGAVTNETDKRMDFWYLDIRLHRENGTIMAQGRIMNKAFQQAKGTGLLAYAAPSGGGNARQSQELADLRDKINSLQSELDTYRESSAEWSDEEYDDGPGEDTFDLPSPEEMSSGSLMAGETWEFVVTFKDLTETPARVTMGLSDPIARSIGGMVQNYYSSMFEMAGLDPPPAREDGSEEPSFQ